MAEIPIKPLKPEDLCQELNELASKFDKEGLPQIQRPSLARSNYRLRDNRRPSYAEIRTPVTPVIDNTEKAVTELTKQLDGEAVREVFISLLGYYFGKTSELRCDKGLILEGCREFATGALGLDEPPYVSQAFLEKIGFSETSRRQRSRPSGRAPSRSSFGFKQSDESSYLQRPRHPGSGSFSDRHSRSLDSDPYTDRRPRSYGSRFEGRNPRDYDSNSHRPRTTDSEESARFRFPRSASQNMPRNDRTGSRTERRDPPRRAIGSF